jgi:epoxyqueuosine reductase
MRPGPSPGAQDPVNRDRGQDATSLAERIRSWGVELGFQAIGFTGVDLREDERYLERWLSRGFHGEMRYMQRHGRKRSRPAELLPGTLTVISARMDYLNCGAAPAESVLADPHRAYVSRYALGRDYHKLLRGRLRRLGARIAAECAGGPYRVFVDSAPVLEKAIARNAGLGWIGKHSNLLHRDHGSWFFLGEIYTDLPLPRDRAHLEDYCGTCTACITACPTGAIVGPYQVDARRCISYLTIELRGAIPLALRPLIGNRIFGCDDCQIVCPWNRFARPSEESDFRPRHGLDDATLVSLFAWTEAEFTRRTEGSAIRRIGYLGWLRNLAVALGNAPFDPAIVRALESRSHHSSALVREHVEWALERQRARGAGSSTSTPAAASDGGEANPRRNSG